MSGLVFSDLHLFSPRSRGEDSLDFLHQHLETCEIVVMNGDIFDFQWSRYPNNEATVSAASDWIIALCEAHPHCQFHYILGNHDCLSLFVEALIQLQASYPNFQWHELSLQLGNHLFLHGDCAHRKMTPQSFVRYRKNWANQGQNPDFLMTPYRFLDRVGFTHLVHKLLFRPQATLNRLCYFLDQSLPDWRMQTRHCFFGHTHDAFSNRMQTGREEVSFHNTGCAIQGLKFLPLQFSLDGPDAPSPLR